MSSTHCSLRSKGKLCAHSPVSISPVLSFSGLLYEPNHADFKVYPWRGWGGGRLSSAAETERRVWSREARGASGEERGGRGAGEWNGEGGSKERSLWGLGKRWVPRRRGVQLRWCLQNGRGCWDRSGFSTGRSGTAAQPKSREVKTGFG